ncbi:MAG: hypothetical protein AABW41_01700 [Nanoarchaeota archaeon]
MFANFFIATRPWAHTDAGFIMYLNTLLKKFVAIGSKVKDDMFTVLSVKEDKLNLEITIEYICKMCGKYNKEKAWTMDFPYIECPDCRQINPVPLTFKGHYN